MFDFDSSGYEDIEDDFVEWMKITLAIALRRGGKIEDPTNAEAIIQQTDKEVMLVMKRLCGNRDRKIKLPMGEIVEAIIRHAYDLVLEQYNKECDE